MSNHTSAIVMNADASALSPTARSPQQERQHRKRQLTAAFRLFGKFGFDEGVAGHITVRDPERLDHFWVNPMGISFKLIKQSDLLLVNHRGEVVEGSGFLNGAAFTIHSHVHAARPDVVAAAHAHSVYGKAWSTLGRLLDHAVYDDFGGVALEMAEGERIAKALGSHKAAILQNHGLITVADSVEAAAWWYITMERSCQAQLLAEAAGQPKLISPEVARTTWETVGSSLAGQFQFSPLYQVICAEQPDMFD
jgi:ribulose-5-phosphate 4-epimerase/fuculose-1-phosphate aldolase